MGFGDTFDPAGMLAYSNQLQEMKFRNKLYEMQYSKQERDEHEKSLINAAQLKAWQESAKLQDNALSYADPSRQGGDTPTGGMATPGVNPMATSKMGSPLLGGVLQVESGGRDYDAQGAPLTSPKGAKYAMQVMPSTAAKPGFGIEPAKDDSPAEYNRVGQEYLHALTEKYRDPAKALAAYNAGPERVDAAVAKAGPAWMQLMPEETQKYVPNAMGYAKNSTADASGRTVPPQPGAGGMSPQGQPQHFPNTLDPMKAFAPAPGDTQYDMAGKLMARQEYEKQQQFVQQQQQGVLSNAKPTLDGLLPLYSKKGDNEGFHKALDGIDQMYKGKPNAEMIHQYISEMHNLDVSGKEGTFNWEGPVTPMTLKLAQGKVSPDTMQGLMGAAQSGKSLKISAEGNNINEWKEIKEGEGKVTGPIEDERYRKILSDKELGNPVSKEDAAWANAYKQQAKDKAGAAESGKIEATTNEDPNAFTKWPEDRKAVKYEEVLHGGKPPQFKWRDTAGQNAWESDYAQYVLDKYGKNAGAMSQTAKADFDSDKKSLASLTKGMDAVESFETGAKNSFDFLQTVADDYDRGKYPDVNEFKQIFSKHVGDPKIQAFQNAVETSALEYAKVRVAGGGITSAELSQTAQQKADKLISAADNPEAFKNELAVMRREVEISGDKFKPQRDAIIKRMESGLKGDKPSDDSQKYASFDDVAKAVDSGKITAEEGHKLISDHPEWGKEKKQ